MSADINTILHGDRRSSAYVDGWLAYLAPHTDEEENEDLARVTEARAEVRRLENMIEELRDVEPVAAPIPSVAPDADSLDALLGGTRARDGYTADEISRAFAALAGRRDAAEARLHRIFGVYARERLIRDLQGYHDELVEEIQSTAKGFPEALTKDADAEIAGRLRDWNSLGEACRRWDDLHRAIATLREIGYVTKAGRRREVEYPPNEFRFRDIEATLTGLRPGSRMYTVLSVRFGSPAMLTVEEVDELRGPAWQAALAVLPREVVNAF